MPGRTAQDLRDAFAEHWLGEACRYISHTSHPYQHWTGISANDMITPAVVRAHPDLPWCAWGLVFNQSMTWDIFCQRIAKKEDAELTPRGSCIRYLSEHPCMDVDRARSMPGCAWDWVEVYRSPHMTLERLEAVCDAMPDPAVAKHYVMACSTVNVPFDYILAHPEIPWDMARRSLLDPAIQENVRRAPCLAWDLYEMSANPHISLEFVLSTGYTVDVLDEYELFAADGSVKEMRKLPLQLTGAWDWKRLSANPAMTLPDLQDLQYPWEWPEASANPNLTWDVVMQHPDRNWDWDKLSATLPLERILAEGVGAAHPWSMAGLSQHPAVGWDTVAVHPEREWVPSVLLRNPMPLYQRRWMVATARQWGAARRLQRFARDVTCNPDFCCARRIRAQWLADSVHF